MARTTVLVGIIQLTCQPSLCMVQNPDRLSEVYDSSGIEIVYSDLSSEDSWPLCELAAEPTVRIGTQHGDPNAELYRVEDAHRLADGRIVVVNRGSRDLRVFDSSGAFLYSVGRNGEGPGEFRDPIEVSVLPRDSLVVWDWLLGRLSIFTPDGAFVRSIRPEPMLVNPTGHFELFSPSRQFIIAFHDVRFPPGSRFVDQYLQLARYEPNGAIVDTAAILPYGSKARPNPASTRWVNPLFEPRGSFTVSGELLMSTNGQDPEIRVWLHGEILKRIVRWITPDRRVRSGDADAYRGRLPLNLRYSIYTDHIAEVFPSVREMKADSEGNMLVRRYPRPTEEYESWFEFDNEGVFRCALGIPRHLEVMHYTDHQLLVKRTDELGTEYMELYAVHEIEQ